MDRANLTHTPCSPRETQWFSSTTDKHKQQTAHHHLRACRDRKSKALIIIITANQNKQQRSSAEKQPKTVQPWLPRWHGAGNTCHVPGTTMKARSAKQQIFNLPHGCDGELKSGESPSGRVWDAAWQQTEESSASVRRLVTWTRGKSEWQPAVHRHWQPGRAWTCLWSFNPNSPGNPNRRNNTNSRNNPNSRNNQSSRNNPNNPNSRNNPKWET